MDLAGSRVLITGATGGIGRAIALRMHERGASLILTGRRADALQRLAVELGNERIQLVQADLADPVQIAWLVERAGKVDVLVANAGLSASGELESFEPGQIDRALDVNLRVPMQLTRALVPSMRERGYGHVVFVSSLSGLVASPAGSIYSATKFGLRGFALGLDCDLAGSGVGVSVVAPGFVRDAGMFHDSGAKLPFYLRTSSPRRVAKAVSRGVERERLEITVAPLSVRVATTLGRLSPRANSAVQRRFGGKRIADRIARGHIENR